MTELAGFGGQLPKSTRRSRLVKISEAARELDMDVGVLRRWCKSGSVRSERPGGTHGSYWVYLKDGHLIFTEEA